MATGGGKQLTFPTTRTQRTVRPWSLMGGAGLQGQMKHGVISFRKPWPHRHIVIANLVSIVVALSLPLKSDYRLLSGLTGFRIRPL